MAKDEINWVKGMFWIIFIALGIFCLFFLPKQLSEMNRFYDSLKTEEERNYCVNGMSCLCRDKCEEIYGHSEWESWLYKRSSECWCIEQNETRRIF